jgi:hypothetical protein
VARRGRSGQYPRANPNITSTLIAISRQMQSDRDNLIMDAWKDGGTFEGKKATDSAVLAYWKGRDDELDPSDPQFEQIKDNILQLRYGIEQSKQDLLHVQGKLSDQAYANFFLSWSKKVPRDSEFWRVLQKDAAGLIESAKEKSRASGEKAKTDAFNAFVKGTTEHEIAVGNELTKALDAMSKKTGLTVTGNGDQLLALVQQDVKGHPDAYHALLDAIGKQYPNWGGTIDHAFFATNLAKANAGFDLIADRANAGGFASAYASATAAQADMSGWAQNLQVWPVAQSYQAASNAFHRIWDNPAASESDKQAAAQAFSKTADALSKTKGIDAGTAGMLAADAQRLLGKDGGDAPSFGQAALGRTAVDNNIAGTIDVYTQKRALMDGSPPGSYVYGPVDKNGMYDPAGIGTGIVSAASIPPGSQMVVVPSLSGAAQPVYVVPHAVFAQDPNDPSASERQIGSAISYNIGGKTTTLYGYKDGTGENHWSLSAPWASGVSSQTDTKGDVHLALAPTQDPLARAEAIDKQLGTHLVDQIKSGSTAPSETIYQRDANGHETGSVQVTYKNGVFTSEQTTNALDANGQKIGSSTSPYNLNQPFSPNPNATPVANQRFSVNDFIAPSRQSAGSIPGVTYDSPIAASIAATHVGQSSDQVTGLVNDPTFQQQFLSQTMQTLHTDNALDPRIATAWQQATTVNKPYGGAGPDDRVPMDGKQRDDLAYPGGSQPDVNKGSLTLNFGKDQLKVPNLPSYLQGNVNLQPLAGVASLGLNALGSILPGLGIPAAAPPVYDQPPTPTAMPTPTTTPVSTPSYKPPDTIGVTGTVGVPGTYGGPGGHGPAKN